MNNHLLTRILDTVYRKLYIPKTLIMSRLFHTIFMGASMMRIP